MQTVTPGRLGRRIGIYGSAKDGKTTLGLALVDLLGPGSPWGERIIYGAWDNGAENLLTLPPEKHRLVVVKKPGVRELPDGRKVYSPYEDAMELVQTDWAKEEPGALTVMLDTASSLAWDILRAIAEGGSFSTKQVAFGDKKKGTWTVLPMEGDYRAAQAAVMQVLKATELRSHLNYVFLFHTEVVQARKENEEPVIITAGPATIGRAQVDDISAFFDDLFFIESRAKRDPQTGRRETVYTVHTTKHDIWTASVRQPLGNSPIAHVDITLNPLAFWRAYMNHTSMKERTDE